MRSSFGLVVIVLGLAGCDATYDPAVLLAERAPADAIDCGWIDGRDALPGAAEGARACALVARAAGRPFRVGADEAISDGRIAAGYTGDAASLVRLDYHEVSGMIGVDVDVGWSSCADLAPRARCEWFTADLCLACLP